MTIVDSPVEEVVVGRAAELEQFKDFLSTREPALILLTGEQGSGKTSLLHLFSQYAVSAGWNAVPQSGAEVLSVKPDTTEESFSTQLKTLITSPSEKSFIEKSLPRATGDGSGGSQMLLPIVEQMRSRAPFLVLIDSFQANDGFAEWFKNDLLKDIRATGAPLVILVAEQLGRSNLESHANRTISLDSVDEESIRSHFSALGKTLTPPIEKAELEVYVNTSRGRPDLLSSLTRVLTLAAKAEETSPKM